MADPSWRLAARERPCPRRRRPNQRYALLLRNYLRAHPRAAAAHAQLKRALAEQLGDDLAAYAELKDPACDLIVAAAEDWAAGGRKR